MRTFLLRILPLLLPLLVLLTWMLYNRRKALAQGTPVPTLKDAPWMWAAGAGILTLIAGVVALDMNGGDRPGGTYVPAHIEDGKLVPGRIER